MFCGNCGKEIDNDVKFCPFCEKNNESDAIKEDSFTQVENNQQNNTFQEKPKEGWSSLPEWQQWGIGVLIFLGVIGLLTPNSNSKKDEVQGQEKTEIVSAEALPNAEETAIQEEAELLEVSSDNLYDEFKANEVRANNKFKNQQIKVKGKLGEITVVLGVTSVSFNKTYQDSLFIESVICSITDKNEINKIANLDKGTIVSFTGNVVGYNDLIDSVEMSNCSISEH